MQGGMGRRRTANCSKGSIPTNYGPDTLTSHWPELSYVVYKAIRQARNSDLCWRWPKHWDSSISVDTEKTLPKAVLLCYEDWSYQFQLTKTLEAQREDN